MTNIKDLDKAYEELINPNYFVTLFTDYKHFYTWCLDGDKDSLKCMLKEYEKAELYEYCALILKAIEFNNK